MREFLAIVIVQRVASGVAGAGCCRQSSSKSSQLRLCPVFIHFQLVFPSAGGCCLADFSDGVDMAAATDSLLRLLLLPLRCFGSCRCRSRAHASSCGSCLCRPQAFLRSISLAFYFFFRIPSFLLLLLIPDLIAVRLLLVASAADRWASCSRTMHVISTHMAKWRQNSTSVTTRR